MDIYGWQFSRTFSNVFHFFPLEAKHQGFCGKGLPSSHHWDVGIPRRWHLRGELRWLRIGNRQRCISLYNNHHHNHSNNNNIYIYLMYTYDMVYFWFYRSILMAYARFIMIVWHSSDVCVCAGMFVVEVRVWLLDIWGARWQVHLGCCRGGSWLMLPMDRVSAQIWFAECCEALVAGAFLESRENSSRTIEYAKRKKSTDECF